MPLGTPYTPLPRGGSAGDVLTKDNATDNAYSWQPAGAGSGDVTKDAIASGTTITSIADTDVLAVVTPGTPNVLKKILWSAFKTVLNGIYASTGHNHDSNYVAKNTAITGATKTKITYDAKGLVTSGADATQDDIGDGSTYKQYSATDKSKLAGIEASADVTDLTNVSSSINGASAATPVDTDKFPFIDVSDSNTIKTVTGANLKTYIGASSSVPAVGRVIMYDNATSDPNTEFAGTTWVRIDGPAFPGLYKSGDANMGTPMGTFGANTKNLQHTHDQGTLATADHATPSMPNQGGTSNGTVTGKTHSITGNTGNGLSTTQDVLNAGITLCFWRRTA